MNTLMEDHELICIGCGGVLFSPVRVNNNNYYTSITMLPCTLDVGEGFIEVPTTAR